MLQTQIYVTLVVLTILNVIGLLFNLWASSRSTRSDAEATAHIVWDLMVRTSAIVWFLYLASQL